MPLYEYGYAFNAMASRCEVRVCTPDEPTGRQWAQAAIDEVRRIEAKYSRYRDDSVTTRINRAAGAVPVELDNETLALIDYAAQLFDSSGGLFDITSGVLRRAWDFKAKRVPQQAQLDALLPLVGWQKVRRNGRDIELPQIGMELDFGGIGKEYAADRAATALHAAGARYGFVDLGGDVRAVGPQADGAPWLIGIQHPRDANSVIGEIAVLDGAVATSGDYERYFDINVEGVSRRYCHILNPFTGWPATDWQTVSVSAPVCTAAGSCSTIAMLMPRDEALEFLREQGLSFLAVAADGSVFRNTQS